MEKRLDVSNSDMTRDFLMSQCQSMASLFQAFRMWGLRKEMSRKVSATSRHTSLLNEVMIVAVVITT